MGQAKRRGTFEERKADSTRRYQEQLNKRNEELRLVHEAKLAQLQARRPDGFVGPMLVRPRNRHMSIGMMGVIAAMLSQRDNRIGHREIQPNTEHT